MSKTNPADLTLALQKATEGFTAIVDHLMDTKIIDIKQLLLTLLMKINYDDIKLTHNLLEVILPTEHYEHIYSKGAYLIPPVITLYDETIEKDATRAKVHQAEGKHEAKRNDRALYRMANTSCNNFIMEVVDKTWYKELEDP